MPNLSWRPWTDAVGWPNVPEPDTLLVVRYQLDSFGAFQHSFYTLLTTDEQLRANRFRQEIDRQRFMVGRGGLRWLAGQLLGQPAATVDLAVGEHGKPELVNSDGWHSNVSHAGEWVLWAFGQQPVGVDVEQLKAGFAYDELIPFCFGPAEQQALQQAGQPGDDAHQRLFYTFWTRKEAILKATGLGLTDQLTAISVLDGGQTVLSSTIGASGTWHIYSFPIADTHLAALACHQPGSIRAFTLTDQ
ncbi:4'-phosphopantetheinyl transferase superfamily protein [Fibrella sp. WM1]|uniref:4'-phosphopantetheinyl transferase family protein n=1 Tax=Fibrella musci TaxID=3242485 RepID=UPI00352261E0